MRIIGLVGMPGSGKSVASDVARSMGIMVVVMGNMIRNEAKARGLSHTDANLGMVGNHLRRSEGPQAVARRCLDAIRQSGAGLAVVDGIRSREEIEFFRANSDRFILIEVWAPPEIRLQRISCRGRPDDAADGPETIKAEALLARECRESGWGLCDAIEGADITIRNDGSLEEFSGSVRAAINSLVL